MKRMMTPFRSLLAGLILMSCFSMQNVQAQDIHFSQFLLNPLSYNPGMTGVSNSTIRASATYRNQWPGLAPYTTYAAAVDGSFKTKSHSNTSWTAGAHVYKDVAGDVELSTLHITLFAGSMIQLDRNSMLSVGINGGLLQRSIQYDKMIWDAQYVNGQYDPSNPSFEYNNNFFQNRATLGAGVVYRYNQSSATLSSNDRRQFTIGLGAMHLNRPDIAFMSEQDQFPMKITGHADFLVGITNTDFGFRPSLLVTQQGPYREILFGTHWVILLRESSVRTGFISNAQLSFGTHLRLNDAFIPSVMIELSDFKLGLSYDLNYSSLTRATQGTGGLEVTLIYSSLSQFYYKKHQPRGGSFL